MASISSSVIVDLSPQHDGRIWVTEKHTDNAAVDHIIRYLWASADTARATQLADRAIAIALDLAVDEVGRNVMGVMQSGSLFPYSLVYSTVAQNFLGLRLAYQNATDRQAIMIGDFLNTLTNAQLATAFGITTGQAGTMKTNFLAPAAALAAQIRAAVGQ